MKKVLVIVLGLLIFLFSASVLFNMFSGSEIFETGEKVALVRIEGPIVDSAALVEEISGYAEDSSIKAIIIRIDSPGGAVAPSQEIYSEVKRAVATKNVVASLGSVAASGGYYIAAPATKIMANPGTITGSIGVLMVIPSFKGLMDKVGIKTTIIKSGKFKDMTSTSRDLTDEERALLQNVMDDVHDQFITAVAEGRGMDVRKVRALADGRIFTGRQAKALGFVDELGGLADAITLTAELAGIEGKPRVVTLDKSRSIFDYLRSGASMGLAGKLTDMFPSVQIKYLFSL